MIQFGHFNFLIQECSFIADNVKWYVYDDIVSITLDRPITIYRIIEDELYETV